MKFNTVEIGRAYDDYLDSLDDWPERESEEFQYFGPPTMDSGAEDKRNHPSYSHRTS